MYVQANINISLLEFIQTTISEKYNSYPWQSVERNQLNAFQDLDIIDSIKPFAEQLKSKVNELELNLTTVLDEFNGAFMASSAVEWNVADYEFPSLQDAYPSTLLNYTMVRLFSSHYLNATK
jgi:hypothetical protein